MLILDGMLAPFAKRAGITVPSDPYDYNEKQFPHWKVYALMQLNRPISGESPLQNAQVIAAIPDDRIKLVTAEELEPQMV